MRAPESTNFRRIAARISAWTLTLKIRGISLTVVASETRGRRRQETESSRQTVKANRNFKIVCEDNDKIDDSIHTNGLVSQTSAPAG